MVKVISFEGSEVRPVELELRAGLGVPLVSSTETGDFSAHAASIGLIAGE